MPILQALKVTEPFCSRDVYDRLLLSESLDFARLSKNPQ